MESTSFHSFVNYKSLWNVFGCLLCIFYCQTTPILKKKHQENLKIWCLQSCQLGKIHALSPELLVRFLMGTNCAPLDAD